MDSREIEECCHNEMIGFEGESSEGSRAKSWRWPATSREIVRDFHNEASERMVGSVGSVTSKVSSAGSGRGQKGLYRRAETLNGAPLSRVSKSSALTNSAPFLRATECVIFASAAHANLDIPLFQGNA